MVPPANLNSAPAVIETTAADTLTAPEFMRFAQVLHSHPGFNPARDLGWLGAAVSAAWRRPPGSTIDQGDADSVARVLLELFPVVAHDPPLEIRVLDRTRYVHYSRGAFHLAFSVLDGSACWWIFRQLPDGTYAFHRGCFADLVPALHVLKSMLPALAYTWRDHVIATTPEKN